MNTGLLLYIKGDLSDSIRSAERSYRQKFGAAPNECHVNAAAVAAPAQIGDVRVIPSERILPDHYWIGRAESQAPDLPLFRAANAPRPHA